MAQRSSRYTHVSLGSLGNKISLSERQLALLDQRRQKLDGKTGIFKPANRVPPVPKPSKPSVVTALKNRSVPTVSSNSGSWGEEPNMTAPTVSSSFGSATSESAFSASGNTITESALENAITESVSGKTVAEAKATFYGQGLKGKGKKMYDDTGASFYEESGSEASAVSRASTSTVHKKLETASTAMTDALTKTSSHESTYSSSRVPGTEAASVAPSSHSSSSSSGQRKEVDKRADLKKRLLATMAEKRKAQGKCAPLQTTEVDKSKNRRSSFGLNRQKNKHAPDDQQQAFLRNLMKNAINKPIREESVLDDTQDAAKIPHQGSRLSLSNGQSKASTVVRSSTSSSSSMSEDKAVMRKILERTEKTRKKKTGATFRKPGFIKSSSARMKKLLSSPRSRTSDESGNDEKSFEERPSRSITPRKLTPRRVRSGRSPRILSVASRWSGASHADDEADSHNQSFAQDFSESTTEASGSSEPEKQSVGKLEIPHPKTMLTEETPAEIKGRDITVSSDAQRSAPVVVDIHRETTEVSVITRHSGGPETPFLSSPQEILSFDDEITSNRHSLISRPSIMNEDEIEIEVAGPLRFESKSAKKVARAVTESLMEPVDLESPKMLATIHAKTNTSPAFAIPEQIDEESAEMEFVDNEDPDGYADFVATLKAEVAGSHSLLWGSFHELFHEGKQASHLSLGKSCHFDDKTKDIVTNMSTYLKKRNHINCTVGTQLANDKAVRDDPSHKAGGKNQTQISPKVEAEEYESDKENSRVVNKVNSADSVNEEGTHEIEVTLGQFVRRNVSSVPTAPGKTGIVRPTTLKPKFTKPVETNNTIKPIPSLNNASSQKGGETSLPWSGVRLRSVADANKSEATTSSIPASWAKVKLRSVTPKSEKSDGSDARKSSSPVGGDESSDFRRIIVSKKKPTDPAPETKAEKPKNPDEHEVIEIIDLANAPSTEDNPIDLTSKSNEDQPIDLTAAATPKTTGAESKADTNTNATSFTADGSVLVSLAPEPNSEPIRILIGKKGLVKIKSKPGETKARVIWRHDLDDVRSAMLDLASFKVKLILNSNESKDLAFATSEQCMRFANALHEMTTSSAQEDLEDAFSVEESVFVEQLNEEEQRVLEEFRQSKKQAQACASFFPIHTAPDRPMSVVNAHASVPSSPLSEISGPGSALSSADLRTAQFYQKMLKLGIPKEAVRDKMEKDNVNSKIVDFILGVDSGADDTTSSLGMVPGTTLTEEEEKAVAGYKRMIKMGIPADAVRHKMQKDGLSTSLVDAVFGNEVDASPTSDETDGIEQVTLSPKLSDEEEKIATSYRKMLKMMIPKEAVENKMQKDQVDQKIIAAVLGISHSTSAKASLAKPGIPTLTDEEESVASSYRKMVGLRIPKEAIRQKMDSEGISKKIIAAVLGEKLNQDETKSTTRVKKGKQAFHWSPLVSSENLKNSVWSKASFDSGFLDEDDDLSSKVEQFQKKVDSDDASRVTAKSSGDAKDKAKLIDLSRANNIAITLKAFNEFSQTELAQIIEFVDPFEKIKGDRALFMKDLLPASAEIKVIKSYKGDEDRLVPAEKWFRQIVHIKRVEEKIHVLRTMESFRNEAIALGESFKKLTMVCNQVMNSEKLPDLLEMVRQIGNRMNNDRGQEAAGFKLDFLPRLAQTKGSDKKTTALDLVVMIFSTRGRRGALRLADDFPDCHEASRIQVGELISDVKMLGGALRKCQKELDQLKNEAGKSHRQDPRFSSDAQSDSGIKKPGCSDASSEDEVRTQVSSMHEEMFAKRAQFLNSILSGNVPGENANSDVVIRQKSPSPPTASKPLYIDPNEKSYSGQGAVNRIQKFVEEAHIIFPELEAKRDQAISACKELTEFFCESGGERIAPTLLSILSEFASNLNRAVAKYEQQQKAEARKKASKESKEANNDSNAPPKKPAVPKAFTTFLTTQTKDRRPASSYQAEKKSLVLMVNEMLKIAGDKEREDYINGVTVDNPDSRLKRIYEAENQLGKPIGSPATTRKNILRTIEERKHLNGSHDSQLALSELALAMQRRTASTDSNSPTSQSDSSKALSSFDSIVPASDEYGEAEEFRQQHKSRKQNRMSIAERWTRKADKDEEIIEEDMVAVHLSESLSIKKTDSQILASDSYDSADRKFEEKKRQQCISRWASKNTLLRSNGDVADEKGCELDEVQEQRNRTRQRYINRWASKPDSQED